MRAAVGQSAWPKLNTIRHAFPCVSTPHRGDPNLVALGFAARPKLLSVTSRALCCELSRAPGPVPPC